MVQRTLITTRVFHQWENNCCSHHNSCHVIFPVVGLNERLWDCFWVPLVVFTGDEHIAVQWNWTVALPTHFPEVTGLRNKGSYSNSSTTLHRKDLLFQKKKQQMTVPFSQGWSWKHNTFLKNVLPRYLLWSKPEAIQCLYTVISRNILPDSPRML